MKGSFRVVLKIPFSPPNSLLASAGTTVIATSRESSTATAMATAISRNSWPTSSFMMRMGTNTRTVVKAETRIAPHTCFVPL